MGILGGWIGEPVLRACLADESVAAALQGARDDLDSLLWRRDVRANAAAVAASSMERGSRASAAIDGADVFAVDDSPMGRVLGAARSVTRAAPNEADAWERAPLQVIAHVHLLAASGFQPQESLGRPRATDDADDPLRIGGAAPVDSLGPRLVALGRFVTASAELPGLLVAAVVHHELMATRPFSWGSGLVARALVRCTLAARGLDPSCFSIPEHGMIEQGRPAYVRAVRSYSERTSEGVAASIVWFATAVGLGARAVEA